MSAAPQPLLSAAHVAFAYGDQPVLRDVAVALAGGEVVALIGPNGSGKSTLIKCLLGHLRSTGSIAWAGRNLGAWGRRELARFVAYLPQAPSYDVDQTVSDVLRLGRAPYWGAFGIESASDAAVVGNVAARLGLTDLLDRPMAELSGGQRQRVFVGRCLAQQPKALLLDEPNTYLDLRHQVDLGQLLRSLAREQGIGVLMASHDLNLAAAFADRLVLLGGGTVRADGRPTDVLRPDVLEPVYEVPLRRVDVGPGAPPVVVPVVG
ncbi:MAG TPA: ABC transporter ATP-binding protein [Tepidisphaeraceae bacterium]|nr:ABC transporter ATP-binding protein [Tepidisphaeraceae bacterium]